MLATASPHFLASQPQTKVSLFLRDYQGWVAALEKDQHLVLLLSRTRKKKTASLVKDFNFSSVDDDGQMVTVFPISINLSEVSEKFGQLSVPVICSAVEQELRDQGEAVRLMVVDARGQPIMDSSETRSKFLTQ